jgi:hypothetical protein
LLFGDANGFITLTDRNLNVSWKHKVFRGPLKGVAHIEDGLAARKPYVAAVGDEYSRPVSDIPVDPKDAAVEDLANSRFAIKV